MPAALPNKALAITLMLLSGCGGDSADGQRTADTTAKHEPLLIGPTQWGGDTLPPRTVVFTFDDGPAAYTDEIAQDLAAHGIPATFFINGCRISGRPLGMLGNCPNSIQYPLSTLTLLKTNGHRVANHTENHEQLCAPDGGPIAANEIRSQVSTFQPVVDGVVTDGYYFFRPPYNVWCAGAQQAIAQDQTLAKLAGPFANDFNQTYSADWACARDGFSPTQCANTYFNELINVRPNKNAIIQLHDRNEYGPPESDYTRQVTSILVSLLENSGLNFKFVGLDSIPGVTGTKQFGTLTSAVPAFSDANQWDTPARYRTLRMADINNDQRDDMCSRSAFGVLCALNTANGYSAPTYWSTFYSDLAGWSADQYGTTLLLGDLNADGKADVCMRGPTGIQCGLSTGSGFATPTLWSAEFSDANGWNVESYYSSIRLGDIDGDLKADICGRKAGGIWCATSNGSTGFISPRPWIQSDFTDAVGWLPLEYSTTIQLGDIDGDGDADLCGRGSAAIICSRSNRTTFDPPTSWTLNFGPFSNKAGWATASSEYRSIKLADIDGDGDADICGRNNTGVVCADSNHNAFIDYRHVINVDVSDATGWSAEKYGSTMMLGRVNLDGKRDVCARGVAGVLCALAH